MDKLLEKIVEQLQDLPPEKLVVVSEFDEGVSKDHELALQQDSLQSSQPSKSFDEFADHFVALVQSFKSSPVPPLSDEAVSR